MDAAWVPIYSNTFLPKVQLIKHNLENAGIAVILLDQQDSAHVHLGEIVLYVKRENVIKAKHFIQTWNG